MSNYGQGSGVAQWRRVAAADGGRWHCWGREIIVRDGKPAVGLVTPGAERAALCGLEPTEPPSNDVFDNAVSESFRTSCCATCIALHSE